MKQLLLPLFLASPTLLFAQSQGGSSEVVGIFVGLAIIIGLFFLFRGIMFWYWKVNVIVKNQEESKELLQAVVRQEESKVDGSENQGIQQKAD